MAPGVNPACWAMRGMVAPSSPCCPRTSAAAFNNLRVDSRLRACWGASVLSAMAFLYISSAKIMLDANVNVNIHLHYTEQTGGADAFPGLCPAGKRIEKVLMAT